MRKIIAGRKSSLSLLARQSPLLICLFGLTLAGCEGEKGRLKTTPLLSYSETTLQYYTSVAITPLSPETTSKGLAFTVSPDLPVGLSLNTINGEISGTPTTPTAPRSYVVTGTHPQRGSISWGLNITVRPPTLSYRTRRLIWLKDYAYQAPLTPTVTGFTPTSYTALKTVGATDLGGDTGGLSINSTTGVISGTPTTAMGPTEYTITASDGVANATLKIEVEIITTGYVVDKSADDAGGVNCTPLNDSDGDCSLRSALQKSYSDAGAQIIVFKSDVTNTTWSAAPPNITGALANDVSTYLIGNGSDTTTLDGGGAYRSLGHMPAAAPAGIQFILGNLRLYRGFKGGFEGGGALLVEQTSDIQIFNSLIEANTATAGALYFGPTCNYSIDETEFSLSGGFISGIYHATTGTGLVTNSFFRGSGSISGMVFMLFAGTITFENDVFVPESGTYTIQSAVGGATLNFTNSILQGPDTLTAITGPGTFNFINSIIDYYPMAFNASGVVNFTNTIIHSSDTAVDFCQGTGTFVSGGYNLTNGPSAHCNLTDPTDLTDKSESEIGITYLSVGSGPRVTPHELQSTSLAIDGGDPVTCSSLTTDHRGSTRSVDGNFDGTPTCDIGAYEFQ